MPIIIMVRLTVFTVDGIFIFKKRQVSIPSIYIDIAPNSLSTEGILPDSALITIFNKLRVCADAKIPVRRIM